MDETQQQPLNLAELSSVTTAGLTDELELVLIPVGAHEQHGAALPVATDTLSAQILCSLVGALLAPRVAIAPAIPWGNSWHHLDRAGTISLKSETLIRIVVDIVESLHTSTGVRKFMLINGHGGNNAALRLASEQARFLPGAPIVVPIYAYSLIQAAAIETLGADSTGHGGGDEASVILAIRPDLVDRERLTNPETNATMMLLSRVLTAAHGSLPVSQSSYSRAGTTGNAENASEEAGRTIIGQATNQLRAIIEQFLDTDVT